MNFYVTLPSHSADTESAYGKENNLQNSFEIKLKIPQYFPPNMYEVSLVEMSFKSFWKINIGNFFLSEKKNNAIVSWFKNDIFVYDGITIIELCRFLNEKFDTDEMRSLEKRILINGDSSLKKKLKRDQNATIEGINDTIDSTRVNFIPLENNNIAIFVPKGKKLEINGYFASLLHDKIQSGNHNGFLFDTRKDLHSSVVQNDIDKITIFGADKAFVCHLNFPHLSYIENLFVYTDIIEDVYVGNSMSKLLRIVPVRMGFNNLNTISFTDPHYIPLENDFLERIRIKAMDSEGNPIKFIDNHSSVIYKLHFQPKKY